MSTERETEEDEEVPAEQSEDRPIDAEGTAESVEQQALVDLTETKQPSRRFYANLSDL